MKLPPMVGMRRQFYKNEKSRKRGEHGVGGKRMKRKARERG